MRFMPRVHLATALALMVTASVLVGLNVRTRVDDQVLFTLSAQGWPMDFAALKMDNFKPYTGPLEEAWISRKNDATNHAERVEREFAFRVIVDAWVCVMILALNAALMEFYLRRRTASEPEPIKI